MITLTYSTLRVTMSMRLLEAGSHEKLKMQNGRPLRSDDMARG